MSEPEVAVVYHPGGLIQSADMICFWKRVNDPQDLEDALLAVAVDDARKWLVTMADYHMALALRKIL